MNSIRQQQSIVWQELLILEIRIRDHFLPVIFDHMEKILTLINYTPTKNELMWIEVKNKRYRMIQDAKRSCLNLLIHKYELEIQRYDEQYQQEYRRLVFHLINNHHFSETLIQQIQIYLQDQTKQMKGMLFRQSLTIRTKLHRDRRRNTSSTTMIGVSPEPYLALVENPFSRREWKYLSLGRYIQYCSFRGYL